VVLWWKCRIKSFWGEGEGMPCGEGAISGEINKRGDFKIEGLKHTVSDLPWHQSVYFRFRAVLRDTRKAKRYGFIGDTSSYERITSLLCKIHLNAVKRRHLEVSREQCLE
jgi:hypothetical protein